MMADIQNFKSTLPGIDCGACGAPTCRAFAEDVIKKTACPEDCRLKDLWQKKDGKA
jgi:CO dehydrogenase/acetyl-CoA synthase gamma subunit (corrinoid Fe-S protein)